MTNLIDRLSHDQPLRASPRLEASVEALTAAIDE
jgi:hypothetical protein